ncbi:phosphoribosyltransferase [Thermoplasma sp.]|uniref:phosphoribosyltransferase n=1 Tax=Thermoplasma sp. TaxID=1973142 RepID=UPI00127D1261|nr:phosphoribosyltransferase [Thermoplasma sp.]KAA8922710.1 MAG: phosphoribosyltransferase [Thermoplasma sp.]
MANKFKATLVSWADIDRWCGNISRKVQASFHVDTIIGIARGGLVPARILSDRLWVKDLLSVKTEHWGITATKDGEAVLKTKLNMDLSGKNVLVVDDITDTGESMGLAYDYVKSLKPGQIRSATMLHISRSKFVPDYYSELITEKNWAWFIFPWNVYEDLNNLIRKSFTDKINVDDVVDALKEDYDLDVSSLNMEEILNDFVVFGRMKKEGRDFVIVQ